MSSSAAPVPAPGKKIPWGKLIIIAVVLLVLAGVALWGIGLDHLKAWMAHAFALLRQAGPVAYFTAMALLPAVGFPLSGFTLTADTAFGDQLGHIGVLAACGLSLAINLTLTYWLARRWFRPWLEKLVTRSGYHVPVVPPADRFELTLLLRITPGPPFFLQSYLLGLAEVSFRTYFMVSWIVVMLQTVGIIMFAGSIMAGKGGHAFLWISVMVAVLLVIHIVRRHYAKRKK